MQQTTSFSHQMTVKADVKGNLDESSSVKIIDQMLQDDQIIAMKVISPEQLANNFGQERNDSGVAKSSSQD